MMKKSRALAVAYDEASSSDDDDHSSDDEDRSSADDDEEVVARGTSPSSDDNSQSDSDGDDSADSNDSDDDSVMEARVASSHRKVEGQEEEEVVSSSADEEDDEDMADLPLQDRLQRSEGRGLETLKGQRERKRTAVEVAAERLAKFRRAKKEETSSSDNPEKGDGPTKKKKKSKHAPTEASSKRSDFYRRGPMRLNESGVGIEIGANRYKPLDPRTNSLSGHLNEDQFGKNYDFLQDMRNKEILQLKKQIAARKESGKKGKRKRKQLNISGGGLEEDEIRLRQLKQEKADFERRKVERAAKRAVKKKIQTEVEEGKRGAYFLKRKEKKSMEFEAKMDELRKRGGHKAVEKALEKRRKKAKSRDASMFAK